MTLLANKTRLLVTHNLNVLPRADSIAVLERGALRAFGSFDALTRAGIDFSKIIPQDEEEPASTEAVVRKRTASDAGKKKEKKDGSGAGSKGKGGGGGHGHGGGGGYGGGGRGRAGKATAEAEAYANEILSKYPPPHREFSFDYIDAFGEDMTAKGERVLSKLLADQHGMHMHYCYEAL
jgi:ABC-type multidrug transport system ATPase subunit